MLSRIAESLYWIGRYIERAEDTARLLDVHYHLLLEDRGADEASRVPGAARGDGRRPADARSASSPTPTRGHRAARARPDVLGLDRVLARRGVGERPRRTRGDVVGDVGELNTTHRELDASARGRSAPPRHDFFGWVRDRAATLRGPRRPTMSHDDGWRFLVLGRSLERVDMTARLLSARSATRSAATGLDDDAAQLLRLRGVPAHLPARGRARRRGRVPAARPAVPRSVFHALTTAEQPARRARPELGARPASTTRRVGASGASVRRARVPQRRRGARRPPRASSRGSSASAARCTTRSPSATSARPRVIEWSALTMSWRLRIRHTTDVRLRRRRARVVQRGAHLAARHVAASSRSSTASTSSPAANVYRYRDYWGSRVHAFDLHRRAHTSSSSPARRSSRRPSRTPSLDATVAGTRSTHRASRDRLFEYLTPTPITRRRRGACYAMAAELRRRSDTGGGAVDWLGDVAARARRVRAGRDRACRRPRPRSLAAGRGVCQDFVHVGLAVLRAAGIPARYASGYLHPDADAAIGETAPGQSHAWLEAWIGDWHPVDPTSGADGRRAPRARRPRPRLRRRRAAEGRVPRRPEPQPRASPSSSPASPERRGCGRGASVVGDELHPAVPVLRRVVVAHSLHHDEGRARDHLRGVDAATDVDEWIAIAVHHERRDR